MCEKQYKTRQRDIILNQLEKLNGAHTTAKELPVSIKDLGEPIGLTTVYRHLERLVESGSVKKYLIDESAGACFQ